MKGPIISISSLLMSIGILLSGNALQGTLLVLRGHEEGFSEGVIGVIMSLYFLGFMAGTFLCPGMIRRVGHIRSFATMAAFCSATIVMMGLWANPWLWGVMRFLLGICIVGIFMVIESWLNTQAGNENRGRIFSVYIMFNLGSMAIGQFLILSGDLRTMDLFAIAAALYSLGIVPVALTQLPQPAPISGIRLRLRDLYQTSSLGFAGSFISGLLNSLFWSLGPLYARLSNLDNLGIAMFMGTAILGGLLLLWPIGKWSDRTDRRTAIMIISFNSVVISILAMLVPANPYYLLSMCMFIYGGMMFSIYPLSVAHANDHSRATDRVAITTNLLLIYSIGAVIGPLIGGGLMQVLGHYILFGLFILGGTVLGCYAYYRRRHGIEIPVTEQAPFTPYVRTSQAAVNLESVKPS